MKRSSSCDSSNSDSLSLFSSLHPVRSSRSIRRGTDLSFLAWQLRRLPAQPPHLLNLSLSLSVPLQVSLGLPLFRLPLRCELEPPFDLLCFLFLSIFMFSLIIWVFLSTWLLIFFLSYRPQASVLECLALLDVFHCRILTSVLILHYCCRSSPCSSCCIRFISTLDSMIKKRLWPLIGNHDSVLTETILFG